MKILIKAIGNRLDGIGPEEVVQRCRLAPAKPGDAGIDLHYCGREAIILPPVREVDAGVMTRIPTGVSVKIPEGFAGIVMTRSSTASRGIVVKETLIDSGYTGSLFALVYNISSRKVRVEPWERLIQLVVFPVLASTEVVDELPDTVRGESGFGSTGA